MSLFDDALNIYLRLRRAQEDGTLAHIQAGTPVVIQTDMYAHGVDYKVSISVDRAEKLQTHSVEKDTGAPQIPPPTPPDSGVTNPTDSPVPPQPVTNSW